MSEGDVGRTKDGMGIEAFLDFGKRMPRLAKGDKLIARVFMAYVSAFSVSFGRVAGLVGARASVVGYLHSVSLFVNMGRKEK